MIRQRKDSVIVATNPSSTLTKFESLTILISIVMLVLLLAIIFAISFSPILHGFAISSKWFIYGSGNRRIADNPVNQTVVVTDSAALPMVPYREDSLLLTYPSHSGGSSSNTSSDFGGSFNSDICLNQQLSQVKFNFLNFHRHLRAHLLQSNKKLKKFMRSCHKKWLKLQRSMDMMIKLAFPNLVPRSDHQQQQQQSDSATIPSSMRSSVLSSSSSSSSTSFSHRKHLPASDHMPMGLEELPISVAQKEMIVKTYQQVLEQLSSGGNLEELKKHLTHHLIYRYYAAVDWKENYNGKQYHQAVLDTLKWRQSQGLLYVDDSSIDFEDNNNNGPPSCSNIIAELIRQGLCYVSSSPDKNGRSIIYFKVNKNGERKKRGQELPSLSQYRELITYAVERAQYLSIHHPQFASGEFIAFIDLHDYRWEYAPPLSFIQETMTMLKEHYPYRIAGIYLVNSGMAFQWLWSLVKPLLPKKVMGKTFVLPVIGSGSNSNSNSRYSDDGKSDSSNNNNSNKNSHKVQSINDNNSNNNNNSRGRRDSTSSISSIISNDSDIRSNNNRNHNHNKHNSDKKNKLNSEEKKAYQLLDDQIGIDCLEEYYGGKVKPPYALVVEEEEEMKVEGTLV